MGPRIFVSAVSMEFGKVRDELAQQLRDMGFDPIAQKEWGVRAGYLVDDLKKLASEADVFIQLVGRFPGETATPGLERFPGASYTQLEYEFVAEQWGGARANDIYLFFLDDAASDQPGARPTTEQAARQQAYKERLRESGRLREHVAERAALFAQVGKMQWFHDRVRAWHQAYKATFAPRLVPPAEAPVGIQDFSLATLHYANEWLRWRARPEEAQLKAFLDHPRPFLWWVIAGEGGIGKSRLARQLMLDNGEGWYRGTLSPSDPWWDTNQWVPTEKTLIVVDYAAQRRNWTDALFRLDWVFSKLPLATAGAAVRVLFLIRPDGFASFLRGTAEDGRFLAVKAASYATVAQLGAPFIQHEPAEDQRLIRPSGSLELQPLSADLPSAVKYVLGFIKVPHIDEVKARLPSTENAEYWNDLRRKTGNGRWLLIQIYAWLFALKQSELIEAERNGGSRPTDAKSDFEIAESFEKLLRAFLVREIRHWKLHHGPARHTDERDKDRVIAVLAIATLQRGLQRATFEGLSELRRLTPKQRSILWRRCQTILGGHESARELKPVEPDLAGEALVVEALSTLGWDEDAPGEGHFVVGFSPAGNGLPTHSLVPVDKVVHHVLAQQNHGLAQFLALIGRDFVEHPVTTGLFTLAKKLVLVDRQFTPKDDLLATLFDYGFGEYDATGRRPQDFATELVAALRQRTEVQQYLYDSGLLERYSAYLRQLAQAPSDEGRADVLDRVLKLKLLGHQIYRTNRTECRELFDQALELIGDAQSDDATKFGDEAWLLPLYRLFFHDHHANDLSKDEELFERGKNLQYQRHRDLALGEVPKPLRAGSEQPTQEDLPLLIRSAHLWGHLGNQATRVLDSLYEEADLGASGVDIKSELDKGQLAYLRAALFRLAGYKTSFLPGRQSLDAIKTAAAGNGTPLGAKEFVAAVETMQRLSPNEGAWLKAFAEERYEDVAREHFMHRSQSLGDTAHQLIGAAKLHYQTLLLSLHTETLAELESQHAGGERFRRAGNELWETSASVAEKEGAQVIQYYVWTIETDLQSKLTKEALHGGAAAVRAVDVEGELKRGFKDMEERRRIRYPDADDKINKAIRKFRDRLLRVLQLSGT